ncbi:TPA: histidine phosphatase family protein [Pasteurella multocida]|nr:histidine phosphatase family protein [Pasteurella multocida]
MKTLTFYLVRHGRTEWNEQGLLQGSGNSPLTQQGIDSAKITGKALSQVPFVAAYSSVLQRAVETAQYILEDTTTPLFCHKGLNELSFGNWEGKAITDLLSLPEYQQLRENPVEYLALSNQGETYDKLAQRVMAAMNEIIKSYSSGNILIVSHGHTLRMLLALLNGGTWQNHREKSTSLSNTSISIVRYEQKENEAGRFFVESVNDVSHLTE